MRRYVEASGRPALFSHYRVRDLGAFKSEAYHAQFREPTSWSQRMLPHAMNMSRTTCRVLAETGTGAGGAAGTWRFAHWDIRRAESVKSDGIRCAVLFAV